MDMRSGPGFVDAEERIRWIAEEAERLGKPIPIDVVRAVLQLAIEFELLIGNAIVLDRSSEDASTPRIGDILDAILKNPLCRLCVLESAMTPPQEEERGPTPV